MIEFLPLLGLLLIGSWAALDGTSVGQIMISRPLVVGVVSGLILGDAAAGLMVGALLEGVHLADIPSGGVRLPEPGPATVGAVVAAVSMGGAGGLAVGVALGGVLALAGGRTVYALRELNIRILGMGGEGESAGASALHPRRHLLCIAADAARGLGVTAIGIGCALALPRGIAERWPLDGSGTFLLLLLPGAIAAGALLKSWKAVEGRSAGIFALGATAGLLAAWVL